MGDFFQEDKEYIGDNFAKRILKIGAYENCTFKHCIFNQTNLSDIIFIECEFLECDFSMVKPSGVGLQDVSFKDCKLLGVHFEHCSDLMFSANFNKCDLKLSSFYQCSLRRTVFYDGQYL